MSARHVNFFWTAPLREGVLVSVSGVCVWCMLSESGVCLLYAGVCCLSSVLVSVSCLFLLSVS